jgi:drug/metabolite transporter (DMT)-like permease
MTTTDQVVQTRPLQAILWVAFGMIMFSLQDVVIKWVSGTYPLHEVVFYRSCFGIVMTILIAHLTGGIGNLKTNRLKVHLLRGLLIVICNSAYYAALATMPLAETMAIFFVAPLLITVLSVPLLGEKVGWPRWLAVGIGMTGVLLMVRPTGETFDWITLLPLLSALGYALTQLLTRPLAKTDHASSMSFYIQLALLASSAIVGLSIGDGKFANSGNPNFEFLARAWITPSATDMVYIALSGVVLAIGGYSISQGYSKAPATTVAPFEYLALPFAVLWGFLIWGHLPDVFAFAGIALIVGGGILVFYRERVGQKSDNASQTILKVP